MSSRAPSCASVAPPLRVGVDLVRVSEVGEAVEAHGERYLRRIYTDRELDDCRAGDGAPAPARLAARFAAKEAAIKVLRPTTGQAVPWRAIEVRRDPSGWVDLELSGRAADRAAAAGVLGLAVSLTHEGEYASACVVGQVRA